MYSFIAGKVVDLTPTHVVIENQGIGYEIEISLKTFDFVKDKSEIKLYLQQIVREDSHQLFGFDTQLGKTIFNKLISVSGIGPNTGRLILSGMTESEVINAIQSDNDIAFKRVKGVGPKTAKRIILDLRDKLGDIADAGNPSGMKDSGQSGNTVKEEALSALVALGFKRNQVLKAIDQVITKSEGDTSVEDVIKSALKTLTGGS